jgi:hypothetical protein
MQTRLRKIAKYIAVPAMLLSSGMAFHTQTLSAASRTSPSAITPMLESRAGGPSVTRTTSMTPPLAQSSGNVSLLEQARKISEEAI